MARSNIYGNNQVVEPINYFREPGSSIKENLSERRTIKLFKNKKEKRKKESRKRHGTCSPGKVLNNIQSCM